MIKVTDCACVMIISNKYNNYEYNCKACSSQTHVIPNRIRKEYCRKWKKAKKNTYFLTKKIPKRFISSPDSLLLIIFFFSIPVEIDYEPVGCFKDKSRNRALEKLVKSFRGQKIMWATWPDMSPVIQGCAEEAFKQGFTTMFGVQFYGECWSSKTAESNYNKYGQLKNGCTSGVGKQNANFVYRMKGRVLSFSPIKCLFFLRTYCT